MMQHGNRHRRFEPPRAMEPGAPETVEAIREARVVQGLARWAWERRPEVFTLLPRTVEDRLAAAQALLDAGLVTSVDVDGYFE